MSCIGCMYDSDEWLLALLPQYMSRFFLFSKEKQQTSHITLPNDEWQPSESAGIDPGRKGRNSSPPESQVSQVAFNGWNGVQRSALSTQEGIPFPSTWGPPLAGPLFSRPLAWMGTLMSGMTFSGRV